MDRWLNALAADTSADPLAARILRNKPSDAVDTCFIGEQAVTDPEACAAAYPVFGSPRLVAGMPLTHDAIKCRLKPLDRADYAGVIPPLADAQWTLQQLRGVGPMIATALVASVGDARQFANGRQMAASLGLTPAQSSTGGKERLLGISKRGDSHLRALLIHGARSVLRNLGEKDDRLSVWVRQLAKRSHPNKAVVALANKTARIAWAMLRNGTDYQPELAAT